MVQWDLYKATTKFCGLSRQVVSHDRENKHDFVKTAPDKCWNLCDFSKTSPVLLYRFHCIKHSRGGLSIKMPSYQYRDSHYKDKTVSRLSIFIMEISIPIKVVFVLKQGPGHCHFIRMEWIDWFETGQWHHDSYIPIWNYAIWQWRANRWFVWRHPLHKGWCNFCGGEILSWK